jgi:hypothetical protein
MPIAARIVLARAVPHCHLNAEPSAELHAAEAEFIPLNRGNLKCQGLRRRTNLW